MINHGSRTEVAPMRLNYDNERPSAPAAACAPARAYRVGHLAVLDVPVSRWRLAEQPVAFIHQFEEQKSVQLQDAQVQLHGTNGRTAKATGMTESPIVAGVKVSGVPPRGRPKV
jgi:hypothetical protein